MGEDKQSLASRLPRGYRCSWKTAESKLLAWGSLLRELQPDKFRIAPDGRNGDVPEFLMGSRAQASE